MSTRRERSRIPRATRSSSPTNSTISSATSRSKRQRDHPHADGYSDDPCPRTPCMRATSYRRLFTHGVALPPLDAAKALPPLDVIILPSDEQTTPASTSTMHIPDVPGSTVPRMSFVSLPEGPAEGAQNHVKIKSRRGQGMNLNPGLRQHHASVWLRRDRRPNDRAWTK
ncbi:hypothetical protein PIB30_051653 [Stylosanthes scabra]|uniref:Uncharacterized protein n=1 Tax=Stylosanthes scabra TaxID=79078 RepID=A0ABU6XJ61_9FABA|nr:hypothetical protein [Stylosanthes scabra]